MNATPNSPAPRKNEFSTAGFTRDPRPEARRLHRGDAQGELVLIRGLPGSGKSTMARVLAMIGFKHFEADMFFEREGEYRYDASRIRDAHGWCQRMTREAMAKGERVVVSNTFTQLREMEPYLPMAGNIQIVEAKGKWQNQHGVPADALERMAQRWERLPAHMQ